MALNLITLRSVLKARSSFTLLRKLQSDQRNFADDSSRKTTNPGEKHNFYDTLGISSKATQSEIKKAYYDLTLKYHPDRNENCEVAATKFREVTEAYEILGSYSLRKKYDQGVPVSVMKKSKAPVPVGHRVKYQEFFDSRSTQGNFGQQPSDYDNIASSSKKQDYLDEVLKKEEELKPTFGVQMAIIIFFAVLMYVGKVTNDSYNDRHKPKV